MVKFKRNLNSILKPELEIGTLETLAGFCVPNHASTWSVILTLKLKLLNKRVKVKQNSQPSPSRDSNSGPGGRRSHDNQIGSFCELLGNWNWDLKK